MVKNKKMLRQLVFALFALSLSVLTPFTATVRADHVPEPVSAEFVDATDTINVNFGNGITTVFSSDNPDADLGNYGGTIGDSSCVSQITNVNITSNPGSGTLLVYTDDTGSCTQHESFTLSLGAGNLDDPVDPGAEEDPVPTCESEGGALAWIACESIRGLLRAVAGISEIMGNFLQVRPLVGNDTDPIFTVWKNMRNIALAFLTIAFLIAIFGQALSINIDAYTMKKMIPRMAIASIGIMLSFYVCAFLIDIFNVIGRGLYDLMFGATSGLSIDVDSTSGWAAIVTAAVLGGALAVALSPAVIATIGLMLLPVALFFVTGLLVILLRQVVIVAAVILSPLAFAAWILPNTEDWFKRWRSLFTTMLMMYPIIMVLLAAGSIFSLILISGGAGGTEGISENNFFNYILAITALGVTVGAIPFTLKAASGVLNAITGKFNDPNRGFADRFRNRMTGAREKAVEKRHQDQAFHSRTGLNPKTMKKMRGPRSALWRASHRYNTHAGKYSSENRNEIEQQAIPGAQRENLARLQGAEQRDKVADFELRDEVAQMTARGDSLDQIKGKLALRYNDRSKLSEERNAAFRQLITLAAVPQLEHVVATASATGDQGEVEAVKRLVNDNFPAIDSIAAHISRGDIGVGKFTPAHSQVSSLVASAQSKQKPTSVVGEIEAANNAFVKAKSSLSSATSPPEIDAAKNAMAKSAGRIASLARGFTDTKAEDRNLEIGAALKSALEGTQIEIDRIDPTTPEGAQGLPVKKSFTPDSDIGAIIDADLRDRFGKAYRGEI